MKRHQKGGAAAGHTARQQPYGCKHRVHRPLQLLLTRVPLLPPHPEQLKPTHRVQQPTLVHAQPSVWCPAAQAGTRLAGAMWRRAVRTPVRGRTRRTGWRRAGRRWRRACIRRWRARRSCTGTRRVRQHSVLDGLGGRNQNTRERCQHSKVAHILHPHNGV